MPMISLCAKHIKQIENILVLIREKNGPRLKQRELRLAWGWEKRTISSCYCFVCVWIWSRVHLHLAQFPNHANSERLLPRWGPYTSLNVMRYKKFRGIDRMKEGTQTHIIRFKRWNSSWTWYSFFDLWRKAKNTKQSKITANNCMCWWRWDRMKRDKKRDVHLNRSKVDAPTTRILCCCCWLFCFYPSEFLTVYVCCALSVSTFTPIALRLSHYAICWWANERVIARRNKRANESELSEFFSLMSHDKIKYIVYRSCQRILNCARTSTTKEEQKIGHFMHR